MSLTDDPKHPGVKRGPPDETPVPQHETYLVLSEEERAKGFVRPVHHAYRHVGIAGPKHPLRDLSDEQKAQYSSADYVKFEVYPDSESPVVGRYWTQAQLDSVGKGCGTVTTMGQALSETYARDPYFYGATYCCGCMKHRPVGEGGEFVWDGTNDRVGT